MKQINLTKQKARHKNNEKKLLARHEKFCWTNFIKIWKFLLNQVEFGTNCVDNTPKYQWKSIYWWAIYQLVSSLDAIFVNVVVTSHLNFVNTFTPD